MAITTASIMTNTFSFDDIFHEFNDDLETEANDWHLNNFYINFDAEIQNEEFNQSGKDHERQQHPSQLVLTTSDSQIYNKDIDCRFFHQIPDYLLASSLSFQATFFLELRSISIPIDFQDLQQLAFLTHQMSIIHLHEQLWYRYLQSGKGQLKQQEQFFSSQYNTDITLSFWPDIINAVMMSKGIINVNNRQDNISQDIYVNFVQNYLYQLEQKSSQCRLQYDAIKNRLSNYTDTLNDNIDRFIQKEGLATMRLHFQARITLLEYVCIDRSYQLNYFQQKPTHLQLQVAKHICSLTFDKEKAEQELILFKVGLFYKKLPKSLDILEVSLPTTITTISDPVICQRLSNEYATIIQRAKADLMNILTSAIEAKRNDSRKVFDKETTEIWKNQRQLPIHEQVTTATVAIIEQRRKNIIECIKFIYELKGNFLLQVPAKTVIN